MLEDGLIPDILITTKIKVPTASTRIGGTRKVIWDVEAERGFAENWTAFAV